MTFFLCCPGGHYLRVTRDVKEMLRDLETAQLSFCCLECGEFAPAPTEACRLKASATAS